MSFYFPASSSSNSHASVSPPLAFPPLPVPNFAAGASYGSPSSAGTVQLQELLQQQQASARAYLSSVTHQPATLGRDAFGHGSSNPSQGELKRSPSFSPAVLHPSPLAFQYHNLIPTDQDPIQSAHYTLDYHDDEDDYDDSDRPPPPALPAASRSRSSESPSADASGSRLSSVASLGHDDDDDDEDEQNDEGDDDYSGAGLPAGPTSIVLPSIDGLQQPDEEPLYVNAKQYNRILKRRAQRTRLEELGRIAKARKVCAYVAHSFDETTLTDSQLALPPRVPSQACASTTAWPWRSLLGASAHCYRFAVLRPSRTDSCLSPRPPKRSPLCRHRRTHRSQ